MSQETEHFIKTIEIKNFKCFENFKADGFGRVNLIGGKNNVGKTAFIEACYIDTSSETINNLLFSVSNIYRNRNRLNLNDFNVIDVLTDYENFKIIGKHQIDYNVNSKEIEKSLNILLDNEDKKINFLQEINFISHDRVTFLDNYGFTDYQLKTVFESIQKNDKEDLLDKYIQNFDDNIVKFKIIGGDKPQCKTKIGEYQNISNFGDGLKQYISIICSLYKSSNSYLFLDEIENGIHYTQLDKLWEIILTISKQQNVQVFATTHSKECIESYARVAKKLGDEEITMTTMARNPKNELKALVWDRAQFFSEMEQNHEVRGW